MWLFTKHGFYSVVKDNIKRDRFLVRARERVHLERLKALVSFNARIFETPSNDYRWRVVVGKKTWARIAEKLANGVDYPNFKNSVLNAEGLTDYEQALHRVWSIMYELQSKPVENRGKGGWVNRGLLW